MWHLENLDFILFYDMVTCKQYLEPYEKLAKEERVIYTSTHNRVQFNCKVFSLVINGVWMSKSLDPNVRDFCSLGKLWTITYAHTLRVSEMKIQKVIL
jgi:hypothetical protein